MCGKGEAQLAPYMPKLRVAQIFRGLSLKTKRTEYVERRTKSVDEKYSEDLIYSLVEKQRIGQQAVSLPASSASLRQPLAVCGYAWQRQDAISLDRSRLPPAVCRRVLLSSAM